MKRNYSAHLQRAGEFSRRLRGLRRWGIKRFLKPHLRNPRNLRLNSTAEQLPKLFFGARGFTVGVVQTMTALALVVFAFEAYFGFDTNVRWPAPASSIPATPVIRTSPSPINTQSR